MNKYKIQFDNGHIEVEERESPNGTAEAKCTLHPTSVALNPLFDEITVWARKEGFTHTKLLMRNGVPYVVVWNEVVA